MTRIRMSNQWPAVLNGTYQLEHVTFDGHVQLRLDSTGRKLDTVPWSELQPLRHVDIECAGDGGHWLATAYQKIDPQELPGWHCKHHREPQRPKTV